jgi:signal transduction histidine kinase
MGIADSELKSIVSGFYRGHASRDGELGNGGLGLGLSIVDDCIAALKGDIRVDSERGKGTTFLIELPFTPPL